MTTQNPNPWQSLKKPIIGLAPMDGVTDAAFRHIVATYSNPSITVTEFVPVEAIRAGATKVLESFYYVPSSIPALAQIYGTDLEGYYLSTILVCELGFWGVDINMGCPAKSVAARGAGAGLIRHPELAVQIINTVKKAVADYQNGQTLAKTNIKKSMVAEVERVKNDVILNPTTITQNSPNPAKLFDPTRPIPVSVKTRIGYDEICTKDWIGNILLASPQNICVHGRTLKQMYSRLADWEEIGVAAQLVKTSGINCTVQGNGDIKSYREAETKCQQYGLDGALIGRASWGNPWLFNPSLVVEGVAPSKHKINDLQVQAQVAKEARLACALLHAKTFTQLYPNGHFLALRKHMAWYCSGFDGAAALRVKMLGIKCVADVESVVKNELYNPQKYGILGC